MNRKGHFMHQLLNLNAQEFANLPEVVLTRDLLSKIGMGHQWLFQDVLTGIPAQHKGLAKLMFKGRTIGYGTCDSGSELTFRFLFWTANDGRHDFAKLQQELTERFLQAKARRASFLTSRHLEVTNSFRLIFGEADFFPGMVIDIFGDYACLQLDRPWMKKVWNLEAFAAILQKELPFLKGIYQKSKTKDGEEGAVLFGEIPEDIEFLENGIKFKTSLRTAAKTGFFLDQRDNRKLIESVSNKKRVANFFSYTGGFSLFAAKGGAKEVISIDIAPEAIRVCEEQFQLNSLNVKHSNLVADAFLTLENYERTKEFFDLVIIDPPSFAPNQSAKDNAIKAYEKCFSLGAKIVAPKGMLAVSSCSAHITPEDFRSIVQKSLGHAKRQGQVLYQGGAALDHPFPLAMPELNYLKFMLLALN